MLQLFRVVEDKIQEKYQGENSPIAHKKVQSAAWCLEGKFTLPPLLSQSYILQGTLCVKVLENLYYY